MTRKNHPYAYEWAAPYEKAKPVIVCLHGFTGTRHTFTELTKILPAYNWLQIDLPGHGETQAAATEFSTVITRLAQLLADLEVPTYHLLGYSMGARLALGWALTYPQQVQTLIMESGSPGLSTQQARQVRQQQDEQIAQRIEREGVAGFVAFWQELPLFSSQKQLAKSRQERIRQERLSQTASGLARSLRGMGTGSQPNYWSELAQIVPPVLYLAGEWDQKFQTIGQQMAQASQRIQFITLPAVGHCLHIENPRAFAQPIAQWLEEHMADEYCQN